MFSYNEFKSQISKNGVARNNRFAVNIGIPPSLQNQYDAKNIMLFCTAVSLQGINVTSEPVKLYGESIEVPYDRAFAGANFTFLLSSDLKERKLFDDWASLIQDPDTRTFNYSENFKTDIGIDVLGLDDTTRYSFTLYECFPKTLGQLSLANEAQGAMTFDVTFDYRYYKTKKAKI